MAKTSFDKLFEDVMKDDFGADQSGVGAGMDDAAALGIEDGSEGEDEGSVTFTLDKETAQKLVDVLQSALGGAVDEDLGGEDEGEDEFGGEGDGSEGSEGESEDEVKFESPQAGYEDFGVESKAAVLQGKGKQKVDGTAAKVATGEVKKDQTEGTAKYMPAKTSVDNKQLANGKIKPSGKGDSLFNA